jgi:hypothetical protein
LLCLLLASIDKLPLGLVLVAGLGAELFSAFSAAFLAKGNDKPQQQIERSAVAAYSACRMLLALAGITSSALGSSSQSSAVLGKLAGLALIIIPLGLQNILSQLQYAERLLLAHGHMSVGQSSDDAEQVRGSSCAFH